MRKLASYVIGGMLLTAPLAHAQDAQIAAGVTTQEQMESFGEPETVINEPDGGQTWVYTNIEIDVVEPTLSVDPPQPRKWLLRFDAHGVLIEHKFVFADGSWVGGTQRKDGCVPHVGAECG